MTTSSIGPGTVLGGRYHLDDLLADHDGARFWRATDTVLARSVAVHAVASNDPRAADLMEGARLSATVVNPHLLRVLDCDDVDGITWAVNEWGDGVSLDRLIARGSLPASRAAWLAREVADAIASAHEQGVAHGRLNPEAVLVTEAGAVKLIGFVIDASINPPPPESPVYGALDDRERDVIDLAGILYAALVGKWPGVSPSAVPRAPFDGRRPLRPRQVRAGVPRTLDAICERVLRKEASQHVLPIETAFEIAAALSDHVGDSAAVAPLDVPSMYAEPTVSLHRREKLDGLPDPFAPGLGAPDLETPVPDGAVEAPTAVVASPSAPLAGLAPEDDGAEEPEAGSHAGDHLPVEAVLPDADETAGRHADPEATQVELRPASLDPDATAAALDLDVSGDAGRPEVDAAPLPPFEEPPERPLFASESPRDNRPDLDAASRGWTSTPQTPAEDPSPQTGTGAQFWPFQEDQQPDPSEEYQASSPRNWWRLAGVVAAILAILVAMAIAFSQGRGQHAKPPGNAGTSQGGGAGTSGKAIRIVGATAFDPEGNGSEHDSEAPLAVDGNPHTGWQTQTYFGHPNLGGLKDGVGLVVDLGADHRVESVNLTLQGQPTALRVYASAAGVTAPPQDLSSLVQVGHDASAGTTATVKLSPTTTRYLVVWLTSLPAAPGGYRGEISEIAVRS